MPKKIRRSFRWKSLQIFVLLHSGYVDHPKYAGKHVFSSGANPTHRGQFSYLQYLIRDLGSANKIYRGVLKLDQIGGSIEPDDEPKQT